MITSIQERSPLAICQCKDYLHTLEDPYHCVQCAREGPDWVLDQIAYNRALAEGNACKSNTGATASSCSLDRGQ